MPYAAPMDAAPQVTTLAARLADRLENLGPELSSHIQAAVPELPDDGEMRTATAANATAHIGAMAALLRYGIPAHGIEAPAQATDFARRMVHRGVGLPTLLRCYHVGQAKLWQQWIDVAFEEVHDPDELKALVTWSTDFISGYLDAVRESVVVAYEHERTSWERSRAAEREDAIRGLLAGDAEPLADPDAASRRLRHELRRHHVAFVLSPTGRLGTTDVPALERAGQAIAAELGSGAPLLMPAADGSVWGWASGFERTPGPALTVAAATVPLPAGCEGALGNPGHGAAGFRESHLQARQALRAAAGGLVAFADTGLASVLLADVEGALRFAAAELGPLAATDDGSARLRHTLETYLAEGASHKRAAVRLAVHEKTVVQRVRRAETAMGRPIAGRRAAVEAALVAFRLLRDGPGAPRATPPAG